MILRCLRNETSSVDRSLFLSMNGLHLSFNCWNLEECWTEGKLANSISISLRLLHALFVFQ